MARELLTVAGQAIGYSIGGPIGAVVGSYIGATIGNIVDPLDPVYGPRLEDRRVQISSYGAPVGRLYGTTRCAGNVIWADDLEEVESTTETGGKGGPSQDVVQYTYFATFAVLLAENEIRSIRRIWADAVLIHDSRLEVDNPGAATVDYVLYRGTETQLADPTMEAALGVGQVPAYRGYAYVVFNRLPVSQFGNRIPSLTFEVVGAGTWSASHTPTSMGSTHDNTWDFMRLRNDGALLLVDDVGTTSATLGIANAQTGALESSATLVLGSSVTIDDVVYVPPTNEIWLLGSEGVYTMIWRVDAETLALIEAIQIDYPVGFSPSTPGNAGLIGYYDRHAQAVNTYRDSQFLSNSFRQYDLNGVLVGDAVDGPINFPERFVGGGRYCAIMIGLGLASAIQTVGEQVTTFDGAVYTTEIVGQGTVLATQAIDNFANAAWDHVRERYLVFDQAESLWWVQDSATPSFEFVGTVSGSTSFSASSAPMVYVEGLDAFVFVKNNGRAWVFDAETGDTILADVSLPSGGTLPTVRPSPIDPGAILVAGGSTGDDRLYEKVLRATTVGDVVADLCDASGYSASDYDVTELTDRLRGFRVSQVGPKRQAIEQLGAIFHFDGCEQDDQIVFKLRGRASSATYTDDDCIPDDEQSLPIKSARAQESSLPKRITLSAPDPYTDHQPGSQIAERQAVEAGQDEQMAVDVVLTVDEAKRAADALIFDRWVARTTASLRLTLAAARLATGDVVTVEGRRYRITGRTLDGFALAFDLAADDADVVDQVSSGVQGSWDGQTVRLVVATELTIVDSSLLRDAENEPGAYWAAWGIAPHWRGAVLYSSADSGVSWQSVGTMPTPGSSIGTATTELGDFTGGNVFDEASSVTVRFANGAPSSATRAQVLAGGNAAAVRSGSSWEIVQFRTATDNGDGTYTLSGLLRGRRGTEHAIANHAVGDTVVLLSASTVRSLSVDVGQLGVERIYKAMSIGGSIDDTTAQVVTIAGERLEPWSPVDLRAARDVGDGAITLTWKRRTRLARRFCGTGGIYVPLGEDSEAYEVRIYTDGTYATVARTISGLTSATTTYTAAQQVTDFGSTQSTVYVRVYQSSADVGLGHALEAAA